MKNTDNKGFILISNDKKMDISAKINYRGFVFFDDYGLNGKIHKIVDDLIKQFNLMIRQEQFFEEKSFTVLVEGKKEIIEREYEGRIFYFLECNIMFPPEALVYPCSFSWEILENNEIKAYWTSDFPEEALIQFLQKNRK